MSKDNEARQAGKRPNKQQGGQNTGADYPALSLKYTEQQTERGRRVLARAQMWRRENRDAWIRALSYAIGKAMHGERISAQAIIEDVRRVDFTDVHGKPTRTNNDFAPIIARWLAREYPDAAQYIELRRSVFDELMDGGKGGEV